MYRAPLKDIQFILEELLGSDALTQLPHFADYSNDLAASVLEEAGRFAQDVLDPLNKSADLEGSRLTPEGVVTPKGFKEAYQQFVEGGWPQLGVEIEQGGQGAPSVLSTAVQELWAGANLAFKLCPMLTQGAVEALVRCGSRAQRQRYLPKMVSGEWTGTMNLTEPQAGSDLAQVRTRAVPEGDHYRLFGQKIFITWGDHDLTGNTIHMVLGRIEGAPAGVKGISLFIVPKVLVNEDGSLGERNEVRCVSIEHKLGIHASPTCVLAYGDKKGAMAYLVGEANRGLEYMFIMMNAARLSVGVEGYALAERATQQALDWARNRVQGRPPQGAQQDKPAPILYHPDVKRMLLTMKSSTEAMRALALYTAYQFDLAAHHTDAAKRAAASARGELLIPVVKGCSTEMGVEMASLGIQVHGGMGYIEETGAAQILRDVRITTIYEGTTGIQSNDLVGRKLARDRGAAMNELLDEITGELEALLSNDPALQTVRKNTLEALKQLRAATQSLLTAVSCAPQAALAVSVPYLKLCGTVLGGWLMARACARAVDKRQGSERAFYAGKVQTARFYADHVLPQALALAATVQAGASSVIEADPELV